MTFRKGQVGEDHNRFVHGGSRTPTYSVWSNMKDRCYRPENKSFKHYGSRGIQVCPEWRDSFAQFVADMGPRPPGLTLERKDVNGNYCPDNCVWADKTTQSRNRRFTKANAETATRIRSDRASGKTIAQLSRDYGLSTSQIFRIVKDAAWT